MATIKVHEQANVWSVPLFGEVVSRNNAINASVMQALSRVGDTNLLPKPVIKVESKKSILPKVKKVAPKVKKSELSE